MIGYPPQQQGNIGAAMSLWDMFKKSPTAPTAVPAVAPINQELAPDQMGAAPPPQQRPNQPPVSTPPGGAVNNDVDKQQGNGAGWSWLTKACGA